MGRSDADWKSFRAKTAARRAPREAPPLPAPIDRKAIVLGRNQEISVPIVLSERARLEHAHVIGTTGGGKTKFLEACIRQDIRAGRGVCVVDPHGDHPDSLYRSLLGWLDTYGYTARGGNARPIHLIDPNAPSHTVGFNPLARPDDRTDLSVVAGVTKPTIRRVLRATFIALAELGLTLSEAELLYDPDDPSGVRAWAVQNVRDRYARTELKRLDDLARDGGARRDFRMEVVGPINRSSSRANTDGTAIDHSRLHRRPFGIARSQSRHDHRVGGCAGDATNRGNARSLRTAVRQFAERGAQ
jgi:hypothetical protein